MRRFTGPYMIDPRAFGLLFAEHSPGAANREVQGIPIVDIRGPLEHHTCQWADCYDAIVSRVAEACQSSSKYVVLDVTSPGGLVSGCNEAARAIRAAADAAGKILVTYGNGCIASAAYMLGCVADQIWASPDTVVGSIGVLDVLTDQTAHDAALGLSHVMITSGKRKGDGMFAKPVTDDVVSAQQKMVDGFANSFFGIVAEHRPLDVKAVKALEAGTFLASEAAAIGLVDTVGTFDQMIAALVNPAQANNEKGNAMKMGKIMEALRAAAESDDEVEARAAKKMLAAFDDDKPVDDGEDTAAEGGDAPEDKPKDDEAAIVAEDGADPKMQAVLQHPAFRAMATQAKSNAEKLAKIERRDTIAKLLESRPDFSAETRADLIASDDVKTVKWAIKNVPKTTTGPLVLGVQPTQGGNAGVQSAPAVSAEAHEIDARMGVQSTTVAAIREGNVLRFGRVPAAAKGVK